MSLGEGDGTRTLAEARAQLEALRPRLLQLLSSTTTSISQNAAFNPASRKLRVRLSHVDIMPPERKDPRKAHVLFAGPSKEDADGITLWNLASTFLLVSVY
jgi:activating signal cointegrator complex subunit 1